MFSRFVFPLGTALALLLATAAASAQGDAASTYPSRPVRWVVPFTPGASNDIIARLIGQKLGEAWGQQVVVDNRPGAGGAVGAETVAKAAPDGYTLLLANPGPSVNTPLMMKKPLYSVGDYTNVVFIGYAPLIIIANPGFPPKNPKELLAYAKANPGKINWGSSGNGSSLHIGLALFQAATGTDVVHVPYKGAAPAITDTAGGQINLMYTTTVSGEAMIKGNRVKVIGIANAKRSPLLPEVPTLAESGVRDAEAIVWFGMSGPPKMPRALVDKLNGQVNKTLALPDVKQRLDQLGLEVAGGRPEEFDAFVRKEAAKVARLIKAGLLKTE
ncbi:MAG TPA: tripartite tricarboxylate transporter substrate binding protein [Burkholderiales bacterium]|nr:tripartite tricarboxylate transporter substrate binding protein [Burkholderiales bacterium]